ncbi:MAG: DUF1543 domain-containing protein [Candidatus Pedobacter colombiensis]|uniref:DUF1543 domain-containing protein n=1 Tax=Candidatus Pedobacter colombiensis TaxID=3121371 RepID=A0AAJ5W6X7_9SPHI|nr:DUF1543 domain-containing protein [Pedobacter sp.]WEK19162.1 MAG: DUF1543 domain-containing protein [Pedobacter sp.]
MEDTGTLKLFMILLGCKPVGRHTEQHDVFFGIGSSISDLKTDIMDFWPEANGKIHIDAWREVTAVGGYILKVAAKSELVEANLNKLFFINLGGYKQGEFDELHYKMLLVADTMADASKLAKETTFYKHTGFEGAVSHIDDKYGVDVDDVFEIADVLPDRVKSRFHIQIERASALFEDELHLGYLPLSKV